MDLDLARRFNLDRPIAERVLEKRIKEDFVKSASHSGLDLTKLSADDVTGLYDQYRHLASIKMANMAKIAEAIRAGRALAHGIMKAAQTDPTFLREADVFRKFLASGSPEAAAVIREIGGKPALMKELVSKGLLGGASSFAQYFPHASGLFSTDELKAARPVHATMKSEILGLAPAGAGKTINPLDVYEKIKQGTFFTPGAAAQDALQMKSWSPAGIGKAMQAKNWGAVARKGGPLVAGGAGLLYLLGKRRESQDLARSGMMGMSGQMGMQGMNP